MHIPSLVALLSLIGCIITVILAIKKSPGWYWGASIFMYIFSFLGSFSIGTFTLLFTCIFASLALAHSLDLIKKIHHSALYVLAGTALWILAVAFVDDYWLFYPFRIFHLFGL